MVALKDKKGRMVVMNALYTHHRLSKEQELRFESNTDGGHDQAVSWSFCSWSVPDWETFFSVYSLGIPEVLEYQGSSYPLQLPMTDELFSVFMVKLQLEKISKSASGSYTKPQIIFFPLFSHF